MKTKHKFFPVACLLGLIFSTATGFSLAEGTVLLRVDGKNPRQTMEGFGAAVAWYGEWATTNRDRAELGNILFRDLGLSVLRLRNMWGQSNRNGDPMAPGVGIAKMAAESLGHFPRILLTAWSPTQALKSNIYSPDSKTLQDPSAKGKHKEFTLARRGDRYDYEAFGAYWRDSLNAYRSAGVPIDYASIQNEPNYVASWESLTLKERETERHAGYGPALEAAVTATRDLVPAVKWIGPEIVGIGYSNVQKYMEGIKPGLLYGVAHHLYHGGNEKDPDTFIPAMRALAEKFPDMPRMQTEFGRGDTFLKTAHIIHNSLVEEGASMYLYWDLLWDGRGLVKMESPTKMKEWKNPKGFEVTEHWYAMRHYAWFVKPGWVRLGAESPNRNIRISVFQSPDKQARCAVLVNLGDETTVRLVADGAVVKPARGVVSTSNEKWKAMGGPSPDGEIKMPAQSLATVTW